MTLAIVGAMILLKLTKMGECGHLNIPLSIEDNIDDYYSCTATNIGGVYTVSKPFKDKLPKVSCERIAEAVNSTKQYKR